MQNLSFDKKTLKAFGITMGIAFLAITIIIFLKAKHNIMPTAIASAVFFFMAFLAPAILKPIYAIWMKFAFILSWINTRIILCIIFYLIFAPAGIVMRIFGIDLLGRKINKNEDSYWQEADKKPFNRVNYEKQF